MNASFFELINDSGPRLVEQFHAHQFAAFLASDFQEEVIEGSSDYLGSVAQNDNLCWIFDFELSSKIVHLFQSSIYLFFQFRGYLDFLSLRSA